MDRNWPSSGKHWLSYGRECSFYNKAYYFILCNWIRNCNTRIPGRDFFPVQSFLTPGVTSRIIISKNPTTKKILPILECSPTDIPGYTLQDFLQTIIEKIFSNIRLCLYGLLFLDKSRITTKVNISDARNDSHTPFIPINTESTTAQITIATAPLIRDPMIAGRAFPVAEK